MSVEIETAKAMILQAQKKFVDSLSTDIDEVSVPLEDRFYHCQIYPMRKMTTTDPDFAAKYGSLLDIRLEDQL